VKEKIKMRSKQGRKVFSKSKMALVIILTLTIGISFTFCWIESQNWYDWLKQGLEYRNEALLGAAVSPGAHEVSAIEVENTGGVKTAPSISEIADKIKMLESANGTAGLALTCKGKGLANDYGFAPPNCYQEGQDRELVEKWFERKLEKMPLENALCLYNLGINQSSCEYLNNFLSL